MLEKTIIIQSNILGINGGTVKVDEAGWQQYLGVNFSRLANGGFEKYKHCSFEFSQPNNSDKRVVNGFADFADFNNYVTNAFSDGTNYTSNIKLTIFMDIDVKMKSPTLYAKNSKLGQFKGGNVREGYRKGKFVEYFDDSAWHDTDIPHNMVEIWKEAFGGEDLTDAFVTNNPKEFKPCFWTKKDCDKLGNIKSGQVIDLYFGSTRRRMYNTTDSNPATDTLYVSDIADVETDGQFLVAGNVHSPKYFILSADSGGGYNDFYHGDLGTRHSGTVYGAASNPYTVIAVYPIQNTVGGKVLRAIYITPVGVDTVYWDFIEDKDYRVFSVNKPVQGTIKLKEIPFNTHGDGNRLGRINIANLVDLDRDSTSESQFKGVGDIHIVYQNKLTGKFSDLSQSKLVQIKDLRFRVPFFKLVS